MKGTGKQLLVVVKAKKNHLKLPSEKPMKNLVFPRRPNLCSWTQLSLCP